MIVIDIEMPKSCTECPVFDNERLECQATGEKCKDWSFEPTQNCPIKYDLGKCRTCKYGEIYNDIWCKCHDPLLDGAMVKMTDQCRAEEIIDLNRKFKAGRSKT